MKPKKIVLLIILFCILLNGTACSSSEETQAKEQDFTTTVETEIKEKAKVYTEVEFQTGDVPLNEFVQLSGQITQTDSKKDSLQNGDRFILHSGSSDYQIFNQQDTAFKVGDMVTVYGEDYGFIKAIVIEKEEDK